MKKLLPLQSTILFFIIIIFSIFVFISYKLLLKNIHDNHIKNQEIVFYEIQRETNNLLTKLLYKYSKEKENILQKHKEVLEYLEDNSYDINLQEIYEKINLFYENKPFNIYITDENLIIRNTTFKPDLGFDLSFAKEQFEKNKKAEIIGVSPPIFEMYSLKFFTFTDSYLNQNSKRVLQIGFIYDDVNEDLSNLQSLINSNKSIKDSNAYIIFNNGYIGDFIFKSIKSYKPTLQEIEKRIEKGKELAKNLEENIYITKSFEKNGSEYKVSYFSQKSAIFDEAKIIYSIVFDEDEYLKNLQNLNFAIFLITFIGILTIYIIFNLRYKENLLKYKDKFIEHSVHEIKTPLSIIGLNIQLRDKTLGEDKYTKKIEGALRTLENSYEDISFLHTKDNINYLIENIDLEDILKERINYFEVIAKMQNRNFKLDIIQNCKIKISKIELIRLIDNNLSNAIKYSKIGSTIKIILNNNILEFESFGERIKDTKNIFKKYSRENDSVGGHGLGLAIVKDICEKYNIKINVTSLQNGLNNFSYKLK